MKTSDFYRRLLQLALAPDTEVPSGRMRSKCIRCALNNTPAEVRRVLIRTDGMESIKIWVLKPPA
jgi:hypothetical protein